MCLGNIGMFWLGIVLNKWLISDMQKLAKQKSLMNWSMFIDFAIYRQQIPKITH